MPVNPDEMLIFKLRGMKTKEKRQAAAKQVANKQEETAAQVTQRVTEDYSSIPTPEPENFAIPESVPAVQPEEAATKEIYKVETKARHFFWQRAAHVKKAEVQEGEALPETPAAPMISVKEAKQAGSLFGRVAKGEKTAKQEGATPPYVDESRMREVESLEERAAGYAPLEGPLEPLTSEKQSNVFGIMTGFLFILNALVLAYFIFPQANFVLGYIAKTGVSTFLLSWNYDYGTTLINMILAVLTFAAGILMLARIGKGYSISGVICASMILAVSFEYLTSNATYLLLVSGMAFISIGTLAYSRMSSVSLSETEIAPEEVNWPRFETF